LEGMRGVCLEGRSVSLYLHVRGLSSVQVEFRPPPANWSMLGGVEEPEGEGEEEGEDGRTFFYQKWYAPVYPFCIAYAIPAVCGDSDRK